MSILAVAFAAQASVQGLLLDLTCSEAVSTTGSLGNASLGLALGPTEKDQNPFSAIPKESLEILEKIPAPKHDLSNPFSILENCTFLEPTSNSHSQHASTPSYPQGESLVILKIQQDDAHQDGAQQDVTQSEFPMIILNNAACPLGSPFDCGFFSPFKEV